jgi:RNA polymerase sigma-70 factor (ECF subfamily)
MTREPAEPAPLVEGVDWHEPAQDAGASSEPHIELPSFDQMYALYFGFTWRVLSHLGVPRPALDDAVQDVWFIVHRRLSTFDGNSEMRTWLFSIAANVARNRRRLEARRAKAPPPFHLHQQSPLADPELVHAGREAWGFVRSFLDTVDDQRRAIFVCSLLEHMSALETSEATGLDVSAVYKRIRSLRLAFKAWLDLPSNGGEPSP